MHIQSRTTYWLAVMLMIGTTACAQRETSPGSDDATVKGEVERRLAADPEIGTAAPNIRVSAAEGTVTLTGNVASEAQKREAEDVAEDVRGVERVQNQIAVARAGAPGAGAPGGMGAPGAAGAPGAPGAAAR